MPDLSFASDFPQPTREQWLKLVEGVLKGAAFDKVLVGTTADGLRIEPLYGKAEGASPVIGRTPGAPWQLLARIDHPDAKTANAQALHDLENGATGLHLVFAGSVGAHGFGLPDGSTQTVETALDGVVLDAGIRLEIDLSMQTKDAAEAVMALVERRKLDPAACAIAFGYDPMGQMALHGGAPIDWPTLAPMFGALGRAILDRGFGGSVCSADGRLVHSAGGTEAQELAFTIASALAYWRALEAAGVPAEAGRAAIGFRLAADADQFMTMAKLRALRRLWAHVETSAGLAPRPIRLEAETAWRMMTRRDPWVNLLRTTVAVFAAGVGGADAVTVMPFTQALGLPDAFARRLARNTQLVLLEESNLARVADPAAGAGGIEALTDQLAGKAWALVQEIERKGGLHAALADGSFQTGVVAAREARAKALARRKEALTGTSEFPHIAEAAVAVAAPLPRTEAQGFGQFPPLAPMRLAEPYEALRDRADAATERPSVFIATLGPVADFTARATFVKNLFEAGGIAAPVGDGFMAGEATDLGALVAAYQASGARVACLCSTDARYAVEAAAAARALKAAGCTRLWLAGRAGEMEAALREAGVDGFVFAGCDVLATLSEAHATLGLE
ncbi:methylmalonyl-CoA mutase family protein [Alsobacter sp. R-9]